MFLHLFYIVRKEVLYNHMNYTTHKRIQKPISSEKYNVGVFNTNMDIIDSELNKHNIKDSALENSINNEVTRAKNAENNLDSKKADKTTVESLSHEIMSNDQPTNQKNGDYWTKLL